jgi:hypothetical protein
LLIGDGGCVAHDALVARGDQAAVRQRDQPSCAQRERRRRLRRNPVG